jgi:hypothetical protein
VNSGNCFTGIVVAAFVLLLVLVLAMVLFGSGRDE